MTNANLGMIVLRLESVENVYVWDISSVVRSEVPLHLGRGPPCARQQRRRPRVFQEEFAAEGARRAGARHALPQQPLRLWRPSRVTVSPGLFAVLLSRVPLTRHIPTTAISVMVTSLNLDIA